MTKPVQTALAALRSGFGLLRTEAPSGPSIGLFSERSARLYMRARLWVNASGAVALAALSWSQGWWVGFVPASLAAALTVHALLRRQDTTVLASSLVMDVTAMGVAMVVIGIPTVAAVLAITISFLTGLLLDRRKSTLLSIYVLGWAAAAFVVDTAREEPTSPAISQVPWVVAITLFAVFLIREVSKRVAATVRDLEDQRAQFLGEIAHDLRNPLTGIVGAAALLGETPGELSAEERNELTALILGQAADASRMVDDLLTAARFDANSIRVETQLFDIGQLVMGTLAVMLALDEETSVDFVSPNPPIMASGDPIRVRQVIQNLVSNAIRYGDGQVRVRIEERQDSIAIQVIDNGQGIAEDERESIFEPFARSSQGRQHAQSTGLGLSVARRLAGLMGGALTYRRIAAESVFELTLPPMETAIPKTGGEGTISTDFADVHRGRDGVLRVTYRPATGVEDLSHATAVIRACEALADGDRLATMIITGGMRPSGGARRLYSVEMPSISTAVALVVTGEPLLIGAADLIASRLRSRTPIRVFQTQAEALAWLDGVHRDDQPGQPATGAPLPT